MKSFDIVTIGSATRDVFLQSKALRVIRDESFSTGEAECFTLGSKIDIDQIVFDTGGGGSNTAVGFSRQGRKTAFVGKIGMQDARGKEILQVLRNENVTTDHVITDKRASTGYSVILLTGRGERTVLVYRGASADFRPTDFYWSKINTKWIYVSAIGGRLAILRQIWREAARHQWKIAWNPGGQEIAHGIAALSPFMKKTDVLIMNQEEAGLLTHFGYVQDPIAFHQIRKIVQGVVVVTDGPEGSYAGNAEHAWHCGTHHIKVIDATGAGDAFGCGFTGAYMRNSDIPAALRFATANSESVIRTIGAKGGLLRRSTAGHDLPIHAI